MVRELSPSDYRDRFQLGDTVEFDHCGTRLRGEIARVYFGNPCAFHVEVNGTRYEVDLHEDNLEMVW